MVLGSVCTKFQVCIFFRYGQKTPYRQIHQQSHIFTSENRNILDRLLASRGFWYGNPAEMLKSTGCGIFSCLATLGAIFRKQPKTIFRYAHGECVCIEFQVSVVIHWVRGRDKRTDIKTNKAIEDICGKSTWHGSFSRPNGPQGNFFEKTKFMPFLDML